MKDKDGIELSVGDRVAYQRGGRYPELEITVIEGFTHKMVKTKKGTVNPYKLAKLYSQEKKDIGV